MRSTGTRGEVRAPGPRRQRLSNVSSSTRPAGHAAAVAFLLGIALLVSCAAGGPATSSPPPPEAADALPALAWLGDFARMQRLEELAEAEEAEGHPRAAAALYAEAARVADRVPSPTGMWLRPSAALAALAAGDEAGALLHLDDASTHGFRFVRWLDQTEALAPLRARPELASIRDRVADHAEQFRRSHDDPNTARLEFSDVNRFWQAYDLAFAPGRHLSPAAVFRRHYLGAGSPGLIDYHHLKTRSSEALVAQIERARGYYDGIRARTLSAERLEPEIRAGLARLLELVPGAPVPDVTFVVGRLNSGGTAGPSGMLIGLDIWSWEEGVPLDGISEGMKTLLKSGRLEQLPFVVLHEHVHALQSFASEETLLEMALAEGSADFLAGLALPEAEKPYYYRWGLAHEAEVWTRFVAEKDGTSTDDWIANLSRGTDAWSADLGYFVGARICEAYYARAADKAQAIQDILFVDDAQAFLQKSGYAP